MRNRLFNCTNPSQGKTKRVLCVCSAGLLRSPTAAEILSQAPYYFNTRACGADVGHALIPLDDVLLEWADEIVVMDKYQQSIIEDKVKKPIINLKIGDDFIFRDKKLVDLIKKNYDKEGG